jgi:hypothetical protein
MSLFNDIKEIFGFTSPRIEGRDPIKGQPDINLSKSQGLDRSSNPDSQIIKNYEITLGALLSRTRFVDKAMNLDREISAITKEFSEKFPEHRDAFNKAKDSAQKLVVESSKNLVEQLPSRENGYSIKALQKAKELFSKESEFSRDMANRLDTLKSELAELPVDFSTRIYSAVEHHTKLAEQLVIDNAKVSFRNYPLGSLADTIIIDPKNNSAKYANDGTGLLFIRPDEITKIEASINLSHSKTVADQYGYLKYDVTEDGRHLIHQTGMRGCVASVVNMILMDNKLKPDVRAEKETNLSNLEAATRSLRRAGLNQAEVQRMPEINGWRDRLDKLAQEADQRGPLILSVGGEIGGHVIILDYINLDTGIAKIRDPYHGWAVETEAKGIAKRFDGAYIRTKNTQ